MSRSLNCLRGYFYSRLVIPVLFIISFAPVSYCQQTTAEIPPADTTSKAPLIRPVPLDNIAEEIQITNTMMKAIALDIADPAYGPAVDSVIMNYKLILDSLSRAIEWDNLDKYREGLLLEFFKELSGKKQGMNNLKSRISSYQAKLGVDSRTLNAHYAKWKMTIDSSLSSAIPENLLSNVQSVENKLDSLIMKTNDRIKKTNMSIGTLSAEIILVDNLIQLVEKDLHDFRKNLFTRNSSTLFRLYFDEADSVSFASEFRQTARHQIREQEFYLKSKGSKLVVFLLVFLAFSLILFLLQKEGKKIYEIQHDDGIGKAMVVLDHPLLSSLVLTLYISFFYMTYAPGMLFHLISFLALLPLFFLLPRLFPGLPVKLVYGYMAIFFISRLERIFNIYYILDSVTTLLLSASIVVYFIYMLRHWDTLWADRKNKRDSYYYLAWGILVLFIIVILAEYVGFHRLSSFLCASFIAVFNMALFTVVTYTITIRIAYFVLHMAWAQKVHVFRLYRENIYSWLRKVLKILAFVYWLIPALIAIRVKEMLFQWFGETFTSPWKIGDMSFSLWEIILFIIVIYISVWSSRVIRIFLQDELLERMKLPKGIPQAISMMVRVGMVTLGLVIAMNILGINLDKITIIIGALGVGIGFGLQDIIRNLISGFIIAFERPINIGDTIQLSSLNIYGIVKSIGIRSSIIKTYDGAEVIIPNGNLISNEMINWTHSDHLKRQEIRVGVAYNSDLDKVLKVLKKATDEEENVLKEPETMIVFEGFQDSSIEFRVLFWTQVEIGFTTKTAVALHINRLLKEAGIVIPFPQRDLYLKSVPEGKNVSTTDKTSDKQADIED